MFYVHYTRIEYGNPPSGKRYRKKKPGHVSCGPFSTYDEADRWRKEKGIMNADITEKPIGYLIRVNIQ